MCFKHKRVLKFCIKIYKLSPFTNNIIKWTKLNIYNLSEGFQHLDTLIAHFILLFKYCYHARSLESSHLTFVVVDKLVGLRVDVLTRVWYFITILNNFYCSGPIPSCSFLTWVPLYYLVEHLIVFIFKFKNLSSCLILNNLLLR